MKDETSIEDSEAAPFVGLSTKWSSVVSGILAVVFVAIASASFLREAGFINGPAFLIVSSVLGVGLIALIWFDLHEYRLPDLINYSLIIAGLIVTYHFRRFALTDAVIGGLIGYGVIWGLNQAYVYLRNQSGIGLGDAKLMAVGGVWLGAWNLPFLMLGASVFGLTFIVIRRLYVRSAKTSESSPIAFGPAIAVTIWLIWCLPWLSLNR